MTNTISIALSALGARGAMALTDALPTLVAGSATLTQNTALDIKNVVLNTINQYGTGDAAWVAAAAAGVDIFVPAGAYSTTTSHTFTAQVVFATGAVVTVATGTTLTFNGGVSAGAYHIFTNATAGLGTVTINTELTRDLLPEWWGLGTDAKPAFQAAINCAAANTNGGVIRLAPYTYTLNSGVAWTGNKIRIRGEGKGTSTIVYAGTTGTVIQIGDNVANPGDCEVSGIGFYGVPAMTSGQIIAAQNGHQIELRDLAFNTGMYDCIFLRGNGAQFLYKIDDIEINSGHNGILIGDGTGGQLVQDVWITNSSIYNSTNVGIYLVNASGVYVDNVDLGSCAVGVGTYPAVNQVAEFAFFNGVTCDTCTSDGWKFATNGGGVKNINLTNCWGSTCGATSNQVSGLLIQATGGTMAGFAISNFTALGNGGSGIVIEKDTGTLTGVNIVNPVCAQNSAASSGTKHGIEITAGTTDFSIIGGISSPNGTLGGVNSQGYGVFVDAGASDRYVIQAVNLHGNVTGTLSDGGTGTNKIVSPNIT